MYFNVGLNEELDALSAVAMHREAPSLCAGCIETPSTCAG